MLVWLHCVRTARVQARASGAWPSYQARKFRLEWKKFAKLYLHNSYPRVTYAFNQTSWFGHLTRRSFGSVVPSTAPRRESVKTHCLGGRTVAKKKKAKKKAAKKAKKKK
jgi:hypothetical protein